MGEAGQGCVEGFLPVGGGHDALRVELGLEFAGFRPGLAAGEFRHHTFSDSPGRQKVFP